MDFLEEYCNQIKRAGRELYQDKMPELTEELFSIYEKTGNRTQYESVYFLRRKYLATFGMLSILYDEEEAIKKLEEVIKEICEEECWALPAHVDRANNKDWRITVELFASETAQALAEITGILGEKLSKEVRQTVKDEVMRRVLVPFMDSKVETWWWEHSKMNWCAVCNGAIGSALLYLLQDDKEVLDRCLERICTSLSYYIEGFSDGGACMEGLGYFTYGMTYFVGFAEQMYRYSKGKVDLLENEKVERIASFQEKCYFSNGRTLSFSDGKSKERFRMGLTSFLASRYETVHIPKLSLAAGYEESKCFRWMACYRDYSWTKTYFDSKNCMEQRKQTNCPTIFKEAQWFLCESTNGCGIAVKGGSNGEPHNHNDVGSFLYFAGEDVFLPDLGAGEYTKDYFHHKRYEIFCNSSFSHSVPIINEEPQVAGTKHCCKRFEVTEEDTVIMDITDAYEKGSMKELLRTIHFDRDNGEVEVLDSFIETTKTTRLQENLISYDKPSIEGTEFVLPGKQGTLRISVDGSALSVVEAEHRMHNGTSKTVYRMIWDVSLLEGKSRFFIKPIIGCVE